MKATKVNDTYNIELNEKEAKEIISALAKTSAKGETLDVSIEFENMLWDCNNNTQNERT